MKKTGKGKETGKGITISIAIQIVCLYACMLV